MPKEIVINDKLAGRRADVVATEYLPKLSRSYIHSLFDAGQITVNKQKTKAGHKLKVSDTLYVEFDPDEITHTEEINLPLIYEDKNVLVINKPAGVISHSRGRYWYESSVASFIRQKTSQEGDRAGIVHRLDRSTSGVMICAKNTDTLKMLQKQFATKKAKKTYVAIVSGHMKHKEAIIDMPIERNPKQPQMFRTGQNGKQARTGFQVIKSYKMHDKLILTPYTGRTHQLRVHLKHLGHPILGDTLYGIETHSRLMLHALSLEITLPGLERRTFIAAEPYEFKKYTD